MTKFNFWVNLFSVSQIVDTSIDENQISKYLGLSVISSPDTLFRNIKKVNPAETIYIDYSNSKLARRHNFTGI